MKRFVKLITNFWLVCFALRNIHWVYSFLRTSYPVVNRLFVTLFSTKIGILFMMKFNEVMALGPVKQYGQTVYGFFGLRSVLAIIAVHLLAKFFNELAAFMLMTMDALGKMFAGIYHMFLSFGASMELGRAERINKKNRRYLHLILNDRREEVLDITSSEDIGSSLVANVYFNVENKAVKVFCAGRVLGVLGSGWSEFSLDGCCFKVKIV